MRLYADLPDPVVFMSVNTSGHLYDDFLCLTFLHTHREGSDLSGEVPEESDQFRFLQAQLSAPVVYKKNGKEKRHAFSFLKNEHKNRVSIPLDLSTSPFIPLPPFIRSRHPPPLLTPSLVLLPQHCLRDTDVCSFFLA
jgi:hypothetical protein